MLLSAIIPTFNERATLGRVLAAIAQVMPEVAKEVVIVDDGSTDGTRDWLAAMFPNGTHEFSALTLNGDELVLHREPGPDAQSISIVVIYHDHNKGKGGALRTGFEAAKGDILIIQDADLEYDPQDWVPMYDLIARRGIADVVFGCRFYGAPHRSLYFHHFLANRTISFLFNLLYNQTLMDIEVCYKMMRREVLQDVELICSDFGIEIELSAKIALARRWRIYETAISYYGRTYSEGKKIGWKDGVKALWYLIRFRFAP